LWVLWLKYFKKSKLQKGAIFKKKILNNISLISFTCCYCTAEKSALENSSKVIVPDLSESNLLNAKSMS